MPKLRCIAVDDEPLALELLEDNIRQVPFLELVASCHNAFEAMDILHEQGADLIFLDIQMPKINGFEMLELIDNPPAVIFTTAFEEYAIKAFETHAVDYLLKPFSADRFNKALQKIAAVQKSSSDEKLKAVVETAAATGIQSNRIVVKDGGKIKIIPVHQVQYLEAADDYVKIIAGDGIFLKKKTMQFFEESLQPYQFARVHRSYIINTQLITRIDPHERESHLVLLSTGVRIPVSKAGYLKLKEILGL